MYDLYSVAFLILMNNSLYINFHYTHKKCIMLLKWSCVSVIKAHLLVDFKRDKRQIKNI